MPERVAAIVSGIAEGCRRAGVALVGGETAEHPGLLEPDEYDVAGAGTGVVEADDLLGPDRVRSGDVLVAMASSGLHSNGYSLARHVLFDRRRLGRWTGTSPSWAAPSGEELLEPTRIYALDVLDLIAGGGVHALSHITGGGIAANLARVLPADLHGEIVRGTWRPPPIFGLIAGLGGVALAERERTFNEGIGMIAVVAPEAVDGAVRAAGPSGGCRPGCAATIRTRTLAGQSGTPRRRAGRAGRSRLVGEHP